LAPVQHPKIETFAQAIRSTQRAEITEMQIYLAQ